MPMARDKALLVMTLVARRSSGWAHDVVTGSPIGKGVVSDDAVRRYAADIMDALAILTDEDRGNWVSETLAADGQEQAKGE